MYNRYRLASTVYDREEETRRILPEKRVFLSVEGNVAEKEYFDGLSKNRVKIGIDLKYFIKLYTQCWLTIGKITKGKAKNADIIASQFHLKEKIYMYQQNGLMRAEKT